MLTVFVDAHVDLFRRVVAMAKQIEDFTTLTDVDEMTLLRGNWAPVQATACSKHV